MQLSDVKIPLPKFLKLLTSNNVPVPKAMAVAGKIYKEYNTPDKLAQLTDVKLNAAGVNEKEDRKLVLVALRKAGYIYKGKPLIVSDEKSSEPVAGPSSAPSKMTAVQVVTTSPKKRKRKRTEDANEFLPDGPTDEAEKYGSLEFNEILDEEVLKTKFTVMNRAPLMTAWATTVAERLNFQREEALSIASVYTEMNAVSKGISLGLFRKDEERGLEAARGGSQPYVEVMNRRPLYRTQTGQWRALSNGTPAKPSTAFSYISRSFLQTTPHIIGALKLLAQSYSPQELNQKAWGLYAEFRPVVDGWGQRSEVRCEAILNLRKKRSEAATESVDSAAGALNIENMDQKADVVDEDGPERKRSRGMTLEEYEAALDEDTTFDDINLDFGPNVSSETVKEQ